MSGKNLDDAKVPTFREAANDFVAGSIAGAASVMVGQPLDTVKIRLQLFGTERYKGAVDCFKTIVRDEGGMSLFRGMLAPLLATSLVNAVLFSTYGRVLKLLTKDPSADINDPNAMEAKASYTHILMAGMCAGVPQALILGPTELLKIRMQQDSTQYRNISHCLKRTYKVGGFPSLFQGTISTILRDVPSIGAYFLTYRFCRNQLDQHMPASEVLAAFVAGALAGAASWVVVYPVDVAKTTIQTLPYTSPAKQRSLPHILSSVYKKHGFAHLYRGLGTAIVRSLPVNAVVFPVYEVCLRALEKIKI